VPRLERLSQVARTSLETRPVDVHHDTPFVPPRGPLNTLRLALVTTAGLHLRGDQPFTVDDRTFRVIPGTARPADLVSSHTSIGFDRSGQTKDLNVVLPLDRIAELVERGELGGVAPNHYALLGAQSDSTRVAAQSGDELARRLREDGADVVLLTPT
jgi:D-proline reductase (dithiol) PrdB